MAQFPYLDIDDRVATIDTWSNFDQTNLPTLPDYATSKNTNNINKGIQFGDGYKSSYTFGLNSVRPEWSVRFTVDIATADDFEVFFNRYAGETNSPFEWTPPDSSLPLLWRIDEWSVEQSSSSSVVFSTTFRRVFEPRPSQLIGYVTDCIPEEAQLCEQDLGSFNGFADAWVARLDGSLNVYQEYVYNGVPGTAYYGTGTNIWVSSTGYIFVFYQLGSFFYLTKLKPNGSREWTYKYWNIDSYGLSNNGWAWTITGSDDDNTVAVFSATFGRPRQEKLYNRGYMAVFMLFNQSNGDVIRQRFHPVGMAYVGNSINSNLGYCQAYGNTAFTFTWNTTFHDSINKRFWFYTEQGGFCFASDTGLMKYRAYSVIYWYETGLLGDQYYTVGIQANWVPWLIPGTVNASFNVPSGGYRWASYNTGSFGQQPWKITFLGNGQAIGWSYPFNNAASEVIIIGLNEITNQPYVVDQVKVTLPAWTQQFGWAKTAPTTWTPEYQTTQGTAWIDIPQEKIYLEGRWAGGPSCIELAVEVSTGGKVTSITGVTARSYMNTSFATGRTGSGHQSVGYKSDYVRSLKRVSVTFSNAWEVAVASMNRVMNTNGQDFSVSAGAINGAIDTSYSINGTVNLVPSVTRTGFVTALEGPFAVGGQSEWSVVVDPYYCADTYSLVAFQDYESQFMASKTAVNDNWSLYPVNFSF